MAVSTSAAKAVASDHPPSRPLSAQFTPGTIVAGRYRLVALLGRGGMGEVYRADDLTLDQPVALKFLPDSVAADPDRLAQFHNELRVARQVTHKNVCRLYDLGEFEGRRFLTMQYVDGEDLASLLRRIGRVPQDKAIQIARQLCAGLAAAHERGVVHRDLKPANVMIDGEGHALITDFGLAVPASDMKATLAGTPHYMAPEQLTGEPASVEERSLCPRPRAVRALHRATRARRQDARRAHAACTRAARSPHPRLSCTTSIRRSSAWCSRCLDRNPARRPASALAVAAALPGADPLADALAAGETPSPEMLAAAGEVDALPVAYGLAGIACVVAGVIAAATLAPRATEARLVPLDRPALLLADRAEQILAALGYTEPRGDVAYGFATVAGLSKLDGEERTRARSAGRAVRPAFRSRSNSGTGRARDRWCRSPVRRRPLVRRIRRSR